jgi:hypothetical protein
MCGNPLHLGKSHFIFDFSFVADARVNSRHDDIVSDKANQGWYYPPNIPRPGVGKVTVSTEPVRDSMMNNVLLSTPP